MSQELPEYKKYILVIQMTKSLFLTNHNIAQSLGGLGTRCICSQGPTCRLDSTESGRFVRLSGIPRARISHLTVIPVLGLDLSPSCPTSRALSKAARSQASAVPQRPCSSSCDQQLPHFSPLAWTLRSLLGSQMAQYA